MKGTRLSCIVLFHSEANQIDGQEKADFFMIAF